MRLLSGMLEANMSITRGPIVICTNEKAEQFLNMDLTNFQSQAPQKLLSFAVSGMETH